MNTLNLLIKPASLCNIRCRYCFYADVSAHAEHSGSGIMAGETLERIVSGAFEAAEEQVIFGFQGGEPTLAGLDFFRHFIELEKKYEKPGVRISHTIQTNGLLLDEAWADFLRENRFLVGLSMDGNKELHDRFRLDPSGKGTYRKVRNALSLLQKHSVETNLLCVVTGQMARHPEQAYRALKETGCRYLQFVPCIDPMESKGGEIYSLTSDRYASFLKTLFDLWYRDWEQQDYVSVRNFEDQVHLLCGRRPGTCASAGQCGEYLVIESDGTVYPCDFYTTKEWSLGSVFDREFGRFFETEKSRDFILSGRKVPEKCSACKYYRACRGGCRRDRKITADEEINRYCEAFQDYFAYAWPRLERIAEAEKMAARSAAAGRQL